MQINFRLGIIGMILLVIASFSIGFSVSSVFKLNSNLDSEIKSTVSQVNNLNRIKCLNLFTTNKEYQSVLNTGLKDKSIKEIELKGNETPIQFCESYGKRWGEFTSYTINKVR